MLSTIGMAPMHAAEDGAIFAHVAHADFQKIVEAAADHVAFEDLLHRLDGGVEGLERCLVGGFETDGDEDHQGLAQRLRVEPCVIAGNDAILFQLRMRSVHGVGERLTRLASSTTGSRPLS